MDVAAAQFWARVNRADGDGCWLWTGRPAIADRGYGRFAVNGNERRAHHWALIFSGIPIAPRQVVDHTCGNTMCVRPLHLRRSDDKRNQENRTRLNANNASGVRGVHYSSTHRKWVAKVQHAGRVHTRYRHTFEEAAALVVQMRLEFYSDNDSDRLAAGLPVRKEFHP